MRKRTKFDEEGDEDKQHSQNERERQFAKTRLLLLVQATILDCHSRRQLHVLDELLLNLTNCRAEIAAFKTSGDGNHLAQVLTFNLRLPFVDVNVGDLIESK